MNNQEADPIAGIADLPEALLRDGITVQVGVTGNSMYPALRSGDLIEVKPPATHAIKRGMVVCFREGNRFVAHRVHATPGKGELFTRGDFYRKRDKPLKMDDIKGIVVAYSRENGTNGAWKPVKRRGKLTVSVIRLLIRGWLRVRRFLSDAE